MTQENDPDDKTYRLKLDYVQSFVEKIDALQVIKNQLLDSDHIDECLKILQNSAHKLAGSSGAYGFEQISSVAIDIEYLCIQYCSDHGQDYDQQSIELIQQYIEKLIMLFQRHVTVD